MSTNSGNACSGNLFIVAAPSGGGKTSLVRHLVKKISDIEISISHTTRPQRAGEQHGVDYFFVNDDEFNDMIKNNAFLEYAQVFDYFYGTSLQQIEARLQQGLDVLLDIDWQGARRLKQLFKQAIGIFILPPSLDVLQERLHIRQREEVHIIEKRMAKAQAELRHYDEFDYLIVNHTFEKAAEELQSIVISHRLTLDRQLKQQQQLLSILCASR